MNIPDYMHELVRETLINEQDTSARKNLWAVVLNVIPFKDGDMWCCLWGENIQEGVAAFGETPFKAMQAFEKAMHDFQENEKV